MTVNHDKKMQEIIEENRKNGVVPRLLMHACCAPCSSACIERIKDDFDLTVYFYNPNMDSAKEYELRKSEEERLCEELKVKEISEEYSPKEFMDAVKGSEDAPEGGARCEKCFYLRLKRTAEKAKELNFTYFTTTLTLSPLKDADKINGIGERIEKETGVKFLPCDFKKRDGYLRSIRLSEKFGLYRQNYCGCVFSLKNGKGE